MKDPWHRKLVDWLLANGTSPGWEQRAAEHFKVSAPWIATVTSTDAFRDYYHRLRDEPRNRAKPAQLRQVPRHQVGFRAGVQDCAARAASRRDRRRTRAAGLVRSTASEA